VIPRPTLAGGTARPSGATGHRRAAARLWARVTPLTRVVAATAATGVAAVAAVLWSAGWTGITGPLFTLGWLGGPALLGTLVVLTCAGELVAVRLRHRDAVEELTLLDPVLLLNVLLLPPHEAIGVCLTGLVLAYLIRRRALVKVLFNLGTYATAGSLLVVLLRGCAGTSAAFDLRLVLALAVGATGFVAVNLLSMSLLLNVLGAGSVTELIREDLRLAAFTTASTVALASTVATIAVHTPVFLPFTVLPAAAITYAYRATATEAEERRRSSRVLAFSQVLAGSPGREVAVDAFLRLAREGFFADEVLAVFDSGEVLAQGAGPDQAMVSLPPDPAHLRLLAAAAEGVGLLHEGLPAGWSEALLAPLEADGTRTGAVVVGWHDRHRAQARDLTLLTPLASALAVALSSAKHLARLVTETSKLRAVVEQSSDGIMVLDGDGVVKLWNPALERLSGCSEDVAVGSSFARLLTTEDLDGRPLDALDASRHRLAPGTPQADVDMQIIRPDGERRSVRCAHAATFDDNGGLIRNVVNVHDLTRERQVERLKSDFVATVSHELRTPVTPIKGYAELLLKRGDSLPADKRARALEVIADRAGHLARLVEDLLLASSISGDGEGEPARSVVLSSADLTALTRRACEDFAPSASRLNLTAPHLPVTVTCDRTRTIQVLTNLLSNALKYSPPDTSVDITVDVEAGEAGGFGRVTVRDHGAGLPEDQLERIFEKFHRVEDPMVMSTGGTGLGLFIARHLTRAMAGDLTVASVLGNGACFSFRLPVALPGSTEQQPTTTQRPPGAGQS
jgi:PAS domain S-box-containing protein